MFWFGHHFELPLIIQSFVMIVGMLAMMHICVRVKDKGSSYIISSINFRPNINRRRSLIGKIFNNIYDGLNNESTPIYTVTSDSSTMVRAASPPPSPVTSYQNRQTSSVNLTSGRHLLNGDSLSGSFRCNESPSSANESLAAQERGTAFTSPGYSTRSRQFSKWVLYKCEQLIQ